MAARGQHPPADTDQHWRWVLTVMNVGWGAGYLLGPEQWWTSGTFAVVHSWGVPMRVWGGLVLVLGMAVALRRTVHVAAAVLAVWWAVWGAALLAATVTGAAESWGGPWFAGLTTAAHGFQLTRPHGRRARP